MSAEDTARLVRAIGASIRELARESGTTIETALAQVADYLGEEIVTEQQRGAR